MEWSCSARLRGESKGQALYDAVRLRNLPNIVLSWAARAVCSHCQAASVVFRELNQADEKLTIDDAASLDSPWLGVILGAVGSRSRTDSRLRCSGAVPARRQPFRCSCRRFSLFPALCRCGTGRLCHAGNTIRHDLGIDPLRVSPQARAGLAERREGRSASQVLANLTVASLASIMFGATGNRA